MSVLLVVVVVVVELEGSVRERGMGRVGGVALEEAGD